MRDISNQRFGRLVALSVHHSENHRRYWLCICDCGEKAVVRQSQLTAGRTKSCGCLLTESRLKNLSVRSARKPTKSQPQKRADGHYSTWNPVKHQNPRIYRIWQSMKSRCYYKKNKFYHCYGGRGITVCDDWKHSFNKFAEWALQNGYDDELSIDRIDVNRGYFPENCRWVTMAEQQRNKRKTPRPK